MFHRVMSGARLTPAVLLCAFLSTPATAQEAPPLLQEGGLVEEQIENGQSRCYRLNAPPGSHWTVRAERASMRSNPALEVGRGRSCANMEVYVSNRDSTLFDVSSELSFTAEGGVYLVRVNMELMSAGRVRVTARQTPSGDRSGTLQAGLPLPRSFSEPPGASASTRASDGAGEWTAGQPIRDCDTCPELVVLAPASFFMGSPPEEDGRRPDEGPRHIVTLAAPFAIGRTEVTFDQYAACVADGDCPGLPADQGWGRGRRPVVNVSRADAQAYVDWLSRKTDQRYYLPSEAEWEYAARAGTDTPWSTGMAIITDDANLLDQFSKTVPVGSFAANAFGLHDVHGNVAEWTLDCIDTGYFGAPNDGSAMTGGDCNARAVVRGGSFAATPAEVRSAARQGVPHATRSPQIGFRVARAL